MARGPAHDITNIKLRLKRMDYYAGNQDHWNREVVGFLLVQGYPAEVPKVSNLPPDPPG